MKTVTYTLPAHWIYPLEYGPDSYGDMSDSEITEFEQFCNDVVKDLGQCFPVSHVEESSFCRYHDASNYGVLACDCVEVTFSEEN